MVSAATIGNGAIKWIFDPTTMIPMTLSGYTGAATLYSLDTSDVTHVRYQVPVGRKFILLNFTAMTSNGSGSAVSDAQIYSTPGSDNITGGNFRAFFSCQNTGNNTGAHNIGPCYIEFAAGTYITINWSSGAGSFFAFGVETTV